MAERVILNISSWNELAVIAPQLSAFVYRGVGDSSRDLKSQLEVEAEKWNVTRNLLQSAEDHILYEFRRRASSYIHPVPDYDDLLEWWALVRHYGGPARFIDFTESIYVSAYFAMINGKEEAAIWAISKNEIHQFEDCQWEMLRGNYTQRDRIDAKYTHGCFNQVLAQRMSENGVMIAEPRLLNQRMRVQQGLFLIPFNVQTPFTEHLCAMLGMDDQSDAISGATELTVSGLRSTGFDLSRCSLIKFVLPREIHSESIYELFKMNITAESLFPGLEGLAKSLTRPLILWNKVIHGKPT